MWWATSRAWQAPLVATLTSTSTHAGPVEQPDPVGGAAAQQHTGTGCAQGGFEPDYPGDGEDRLGDRGEEHVAAGPRGRSAMADATAGSMTGVVTSGIVQVLDEDVDPGHVQSDLLADGVDHRAAQLVAGVDDRQVARDTHP